MFRHFGIAGIGLMLTACSGGGGGGGGGRSSFPVITNEFLLPGISKVSKQLLVDLLRAKFHKPDKNLCE